MKKKTPGVKESRLDNFFTLPLDSLCHSCGRVRAVSNTVSNKTSLPFLLSARLEAFRSFISPIVPCGSVVKV
jgi:hypothetical protein